MKLPPDTIGIVGDSAMTDVNCAHIIAIALLKGTVSFADSNDVALLRDPQILQQRAKVTVAADQTLADPAAPRGAIVLVTLTNGQHVSHHTKYPPGTKENPLKHGGDQREGAGVDSARPWRGKDGAADCPNQQSGKSSRYSRASATHYGVSVADSKLGIELRGGFVVT